MIRSDLKFEYEHRNYNPNDDLERPLNRREQQKSASTL